MSELENRDERCGTGTSGVSNGRPCREDYRLLINRAWEDIHHSRTQEWRALVAITGAHLVIFQAINYGYQREALQGLDWLALVGGGIAFLAATGGALMACRHRRLMRVKMRWIYRAEQFLGLIRVSTDDDLHELAKEAEEAGERTGGLDPARADDPGIIPKNPKLGTPKRWKGLSWPRLLSTSWLILSLFVLLGVLDVFAIVVFRK